MDEDLPIDIHCNKLLDWLISRRHCKDQWQEAAVCVRKRINNAIQDMPPVEQITKLLHGTYINYFHCLQIVELLKETTDGSRNLFGRYSSHRMKDWMEIVKMYEKDSLYLAEVAQLLMRNVNYEIPSLKKQIAKCQQLQMECTRKQGEHSSSAAEMREKFHSVCTQMGIEGKAIQRELLLLVKDLPSTYERIAVSTQSLHGAVKYYETFVAFVLGSKDLAVGCVPMVHYIITNGNTTAYQWRTNKVPSRVEEPLLDCLTGKDESEGENETAEEIDWGDLDAGGEARPHTDTSNTDVVGETSRDDIDWGNGVIDIQVVNDDITTDDDDDVARGCDAQTLLDNIQTRNVFVDELLELDAFFRQRLLEMKGEYKAGNIGQLQTMPDTIHAPLNHVQCMHDAILSVLGQLMSSRMQDLMRIRSSPKYVDRLTTSLKKILCDADKMTSMSRLMGSRRSEALEEQRHTEPKLDIIRQRTKELQKQIESEISKRYHNRRVNIMGEMNTI
ncbi:CDK5 regulatory subunit-associated protein 3 [Lamellibrachia satsuma]|nr:CDK5 regulatory subunit-associated protein 3 [Lamellibrachia satsuma]